MEVQELHTPETRAFKMVTRYQMPVIFRLGQPIFIKGL